MPLDPTNILRNTQIGMNVLTQKSLKLLSSGRPAQVIKKKAQDPVICVSWQRGGAMVTEFSALWGI